MIFLFSKRCGDGIMERGRCSIWIRLLMYSGMYCFPFIVFLNVKLMLIIMSCVIYDKISKPVSHQYYMVFLLFLRWLLFGLQFYVCMDIQLHLQFKTLMKIFCIFVVIDCSCDQWLKCSQSTSINQPVACLVIFKML